MMDIREYHAMARSQIDGEMRRILLSEVSGLELPPEGRAAITQSIEGGKRFRGMLTCLVCETLGGTRTNAMPLAVGLEYIHAFSLVHDDIVDGDRWRRGKSAIWTLGGIGQKGAILIGDFLCALGMKVISDTEGRHASVLAGAMARVGLGALKEFLSFQPLVEGIEYGKSAAGFSDEVIKLKTGALFGAASKLGAFAADAVSFAHMAYEFGGRCGEAFQIADDMVDIKSNQDIHSMTTRIDERIALALDAIKDFSDNEYTAMLREAPRFMTDSMVRGSL